MLTDCEQEFRHIRSGLFVYSCTLSVLGSMLSVCYGDLASAAWHFEASIAHDCVLTRPCVGVGNGAGRIVNKDDLRGSHPGLVAPAPRPCVTNLALIG